LHADPTRVASRTPPRRHRRAGSRRAGLRRGLVIVALSALSTQGAVGAPRPSPEKTRKVSKPADRLDGLRPEILALATGAADRYLSNHAVDRPGLLTIIDYSLPSTEPRFWVVDRDRGDVLFHRLVAHGSGSGENLATRFSNREGSHASSLGLFLTEETYTGRNGYSLRLRGLERGINDQARARTIVLHGAWYVTPAFARAHGRLGRSWGCPALNPEIASVVIDRIKGGSLLFVYAPDPDWLDRSSYLVADATSAASPPPGVAAAP